MAGEYQLTIRDYVMMLRRRAVLIVTMFTLTFLVAAAIAVAIPPIYRSTGTILVESQQIPLDLGPATAHTFADERIQIIQQRVMTRENLSRIIERYQLFQDRKGSMTTSEMLDEVRSMTSIEPISVKIGGKRANTTTIAFMVSFEHRSADIAHRVANELVTLFLDENAKARTQRAVETTEFLAREADKLQKELEELEAQVAAYKQQYRNALPEHLQLHMTMLQRTEAALKDVEREYKSTLEELRFLDVELAAARNAAVTATSAAPTVDPAQELVRLKAELSKLSTTYTQTHPDVRALKRKIETLEEEVAAGDGGGRRIAPANLMVAKVQTKIDAANSRLASLTEQQKALRGQIAELERQILQTPQVERVLMTLMRDHDNARRKYEEVRAKQVDARMVESLEEDKKAERFSLLEPPLRADKPYKPDRLKLLALGFVFAAGSSSGLALLLELLKQRVRGAAALTHLVRQPPLVVIPYITTRYELERRKAKIRWLVVGVVVFCVVAAVLIHFLYKPLDILLLKVIARLG